MVVQRERVQRVCSSSSSLWVMVRMVIVLFKMMETSALVPICFRNCAKWNLAVTKLVTRKEQKSQPMKYIFGISSSRRPDRYTKFWQIVIPRRFHTKSRVTSRVWRATFGKESAWYYDLLKFGILASSTR